MSISVKLVSIIAGTCVTSIWVIAIVVATSIVVEAFINIWINVQKANIRDIPSRIWVVQFHKLSIHLKKSAYEVYHLYV